MTAIDDIIVIKKRVVEKFAELKSALLMREKLLLRQLDVISNSRKQHMGVVTTDDPSTLEWDTVHPSSIDIQFLCNNEEELLEAIRNFGRYQMANINLALQDLYLKNEDYIVPTNDHETLFKDLQAPAERETANGKEPEAVIVDFSQQKLLMEHNAKKMNESIINITLTEAKELIRQAKVRKEHIVPPLNLEELDDNRESSLAEAVSSLAASESVNEQSTGNNKYSQTQNMIKMKRFKPQITINNCNGTINLRNIAALTINCTTEDNIQAQLPFNNQHNHNGAATMPEEQKNQNESKRDLSESFSDNGSSTATDRDAPTSSTTTTTTTTPVSISNYSTNNSSRSHSKQQKSRNSYKSTKYEERIDQHRDTESSNEVVTCAFYNRLLNEIKKTIQQNQQKMQTNEQPSQQQQPIAGNSTTHPNENSLNKRVVLKNFENLKIILEAQSSGDEDAFHPIQIEQWLAEIIADTDLEPMQNTDILEHSKIHAQLQQQCKEI